MKRYISALLVALLLVSSFATVAFAAEGVTLSAKDVVAEAGDVLEIPFVISGVDFAGYEFNITADEGVTVESVAFNLLPNNFFNPDQNNFVNGMNTTNVKAEGTLFTVKVKVADDIAAGTYNVGLEVIMVFNQAAEELAVTVDPCVITIESDETEHVHAFGEWTVDVVGKDCQTRGTEVRVCECGAKEYREGAFGPHIMKTEWDFNDTHHFHLCSVCNEYFEDKAKHEFKYEITKPATKEEAGEQIESCKVCAYTNTIVLPKLPDGGEIEETGDISGAVNTGLAVLVISLCSVAAIVIKRKNAV